MATIEYDLKTSGGIMEQIKKLVAPPQTEDASRRPRQRDKERSERRPGRAINHDCCDSCKEGGDLLCCDRCPAAFHLLCHDPPLNKDELPRGEWICHRCRMGPTPISEMDDDTASTSSSQSRGSLSRNSHVCPVSRSSSFVDSSMQRTHVMGSRSSSVVNSSIQRTVGSRSSSVVDSSIQRTVGSRSMYAVVSSLDEDAISIDSQVADNTAFGMLVRAARLINPQQFELTKDMTCPVQLPGSSKRKWPKDNSRQTAKKLPHELDNGMVPLPARLCFICAKSCRVAPLIQCDYCPLLFHQDCLNPPLTSLPAGRWMCPNHAEHFIDEDLLTSSKLSERIKLWEKYGENIDHHTVKINFLKKIHRKNPPFRIKRKRPNRKTITIPQSIKDHYKFPPPMLPKPDHGPPALTSNLNYKPQQPQCTPEQQDEWLSGVIALQTSISKYLNKKTTDQQTTSNNSLSGVAKSSVTPNDRVIGTMKPTASIIPTLKKENCSRTPSPALSTGSHCSFGSHNSHISRLIGCPSTDNRASPDYTDIVMNGDIKSPISLLTNNNNICHSQLDERTSSSFMPVNESSFDGTLQEDRVKNTPNGKPCCISKSQGGSVTFTTTQADTESRVEHVDSALNSTPSTSSGSKVIANNSEGQGLHSKRRQESSDSPAALADLHNTQQSSLDSKQELQLGHLDDQLIRVLAWQRVQQLRKPREQNDKGVLNGLHIQPGSAKVQARALLCPLTGQGQPARMCYRSLTLGLGADLDVLLSEFGHCNFVSAKHACIFYDEASRHYELLNYSEHGTTVDNVLYSCDFSDKPGTTIQPTETIQALRDIIEHRMKKRTEDHNQRLTMSSSALHNKNSLCNCRTSGSSLISGNGAGWEGTAILHHGSYVKFGCLQFVFSIIDQVPNRMQRVLPNQMLSSTEGSQKCSSSDTHA